MALFGLFSSDSKSSNTERASERNNVNTVSDNGQIFSNNLGGVEVSGGGDKSTTNVTNNIQFTDFGAIKSGEKVALAAIDQNKGLFDGAIEFASQSLDFGEKGLEKGFDLVGKNTIAAVSDGLNKVLIFGGVAALAFAAVTYFKGK